MSQLAFWIFLSSGSTRQQMKFNAAAYPGIVVLKTTGLPLAGSRRGSRAQHRLRALLAVVVAVRVPSGRSAVRPVGPDGGESLRGGRLRRRRTVVCGLPPIGLPDLLTLAVAGVACLGYLAIVIRLVPSCRRDFAVLAEFARGLRR